MPPRPYSVRADRGHLDPQISELRRAWQARTPGGVVVREADILRDALTLGLARLLQTEKERERTVGEA